MTSVSPAQHNISVIIPALNEEASIALVINALPDFVGEIIVVDNGSTDATATRAREAGARVIDEPSRGYGRACLAGMRAASRPDIIVFMDGDAADDPADMQRLVEPVLTGTADLVIGSRLIGHVEKGALTVPQRFGNWLACRLMGLFWGAPFSDLGPFRAIRCEALDALNMDAMTYGWTVQMQVRSLKAGLRVSERPVQYRRRIGVSKISGTVRGVVLAGTHILSVIFIEIFRSRHTPYVRARREEKE